MRVGDGKRLTVSETAETAASGGKTAETKKKAFKWLFIFHLIMEPRRITCYEILWQFGLFGNALRTTHTAVLNIVSVTTVHFY